MSQLWFFGQAGDKHGPYSTLEMRALAADGTIRVEDTIWKLGIALGQPASRVKCLFPTPPLPAVPAAEIPAATPLQPLENEEVVGPDAEILVVPEPAAAADPADVAPAEVAEAPEQSASTPALQPASTIQNSAAKKPVRMSRALAIKGAKICGQDGVTVQFKKICSTCNHEDGSRGTVKIRTGMMRIPFYCRKCKKPREVVLQGMT